MYIYIYIYTIYTVYSYCNLRYPAEKTCLFIWQKNIPELEEGENLSRKRVGGKCNGFQKQSIEFNIKVTTWLVVSTCFNPFEKYEFVNWDDDIPNVQKNKTCSKPPTSYPVQSLQITHVDICLPSQGKVWPLARLHRALPRKKPCIGRPTITTRSEL